MRQFTQFDVVFLRSCIESLAPINTFHVLNLRKQNQLVHKGVYCKPKILNKSSPLEPFKLLNGSGLSNSMVALYLINHKP